VPFSAYADDTWAGLEQDNAGLYETALIRQWIPAMPPVRSLLERGVDVADVGCGRGHVVRLLAQVFPASRFVGYDVFEPNIAHANAMAAELGLASRVHFEQLDATV
jgi:tRNA G46 methylase TrmB